MTLAERSRPRRAPNIGAYERVDSKGEPFSILRDHERGRYYRLSPAGWLLWRHLDGRNTLADVTLCCEDAFKVLAPQVVTEEVDGLVKAGFAQVPPLRPDVQAILDHQIPRLSRLAHSINRVLEWEVVWSGVDPLHKTV